MYFLKKRICPFYSLWGIGHNLMSHLRLLTYNTWAYIWAVSTTVLICDTGQSVCVCLSQCNLSLTFRLPRPWGPTRIKPELRVTNCHGPICGQWRQKKEILTKLAQKDLLDQCKGSVGTRVRLVGFFFLCFSSLSCFVALWSWGNPHSGWCLGFPVGKGNLRYTQLLNTCQVLHDLSGKEL